MIGRVSDAVTAVAVMFVLPVILTAFTVMYLSSVSAEETARGLNRAVYMKREINEDMITAAAGRLPAFAGGFSLRFEAERVIYLPDGAFYETVTCDEILNCIAERGRYLIGEGDIFRVTAVRPGRRCEI